MSELAVTVVSMQRVYPGNQGEPEAMILISDDTSEISVEIEQFLGMVDAVYRALGVLDDEQELGPEPGPELEPAREKPSRLIVRQSKVDGDL